MISEEQDWRYINRRKRRARRVYKKAPLFAVEFMKIDYPYYCWDLLFSDLPLKRKKKIDIGKSRKKTGKKRNTKYKLLDDLRKEYNRTKCIKIASRYNQIARALNKPYRIKGRLKNGKIITYEVSNQVPIKGIKEIMGLIGECEDYDTFHKKAFKLIGYWLMGG